MRYRQNTPTPFVTQRAIDPGRVAVVGAVVIRLLFFACRNRKLGRKTEPYILPSVLPPLPGGRRTRQRGCILQFFTMGSMAGLSGLHGTWGSGCSRMERWALHY